MTQGIIELNPHDIQRKIVQGFYEDLCVLDPKSSSYPLVRKFILNRVNQMTREAGIQVAPPANPDVIRLLKQDGVFRVGSILDDRSLEEVRESSRKLPVFNGEMYDRSDREPHDWQHARHRYRLSGYRITDILRLPYLMEIANDERLLAVVENYLGCVPTIALISLWWTFPEAEAAIALPQPLIGQEFHRDMDDFGVLTMFVYLTDVDLATGAQRYIRTSHSAGSFEQTLQQRGAKDPETGGPLNLRQTYEPMSSNLGSHVAEIMRDLITDVEGPAGTLFFTDTQGLHHGTPPQRGERLLFVVRYGIADNTNRRHLGGYRGPPFEDLAARIGDSPRKRYINRVLLA